MFMFFIIGFLYLFFLCDSYNVLGILDNYNFRKDIYIYLNILKTILNSFQFFF